MFVYLVLFCAAIFPDVHSAVQRAYSFTSCSTNEFTCGDGSCVKFNSLCDGKLDCSDGKDEMKCVSGNSVVPHFFQGRLNTLRPGSGNQSLISLFPRIPNSAYNFFGLFSDVLDNIEKTTELRADQWQCPDGTRIFVYDKCDGKVDCPDRSDETHALCGETECAPNGFRCTYGACVHVTATCNDVIDCADQSDELLPRCRKGTDEFLDQFICRDGRAIPASDHCDGKLDCSDGSDEIRRSCAAKTCASDQFQCAYGGCVEQGSDCNGTQECPDGSDESDGLCNRQLSNSSFSTRSTQSGNCFLPPYPEHGTYVTNQPNATLGQAYASLNISVTCHQGYGFWGTGIVSCKNGVWSQVFPKCVRLCKLNNDPSVHYYCLMVDFKNDRHCDSSFVPSGGVVTPECNSPNYFSPVTLSLMECIDGSWDYVAICKPECGRVTPDGVPLIIDGRPAKRGELPWHVGIYRKTTNPYMQICGGSLVTNRVVISAAHCFWHDVFKKQPASKYAVAAGKIYRQWNDKDQDVQTSDVKEINIPVRFQGSATNFQDDIAVIILETAFVYKTFVRPVCLDFDIEFDKRQLQPGNLGKVAGWGLTAEDGQASDILKVIEMPNVDVTQCLKLSPLSFREHITSDKICSGYGNGGALCKGDSGGGLAFLEGERYYLRGIASSAPKNDHLCNSNTLTAFTQILKHENFVKKYL